MDRVSPGQDGVGASSSRVGTNWERATGSLGEVVRDQGTAPGERFTRANGRAKALAERCTRANGRARALAERFTRANGRARALAERFTRANGRAKALAERFTRANGRAKALAERFKRANGRAKALAERFRPAPRSISEQKMRSTALSKVASRAIGSLKSNGALSTQCLSGTSGNSRSTRFAAVWAVRLAPQEQQTPLVFQEKATSIDAPHSEQHALAKPQATIPQSR
jgi:hypothetical protein